MSYIITAIHTYPIKSLGGISQQSAQLSPTGLAYDRFWMLCLPYGQFLTQREIPELALFETHFTEEGVQVKYQGASHLIPFALDPKPTDELTATIFGKTVSVQKEGSDINTWFSDQLHREVILVRRASGAQRFVNRHPEATINFPDGHQLLVIGEASLAGLNQRLDQPIPMNRFRPNVVFSGGEAHIEDNWTEVQIGDTQFAHTKNCGRCQITTIDQSTGQRGTEPLKTLATYRKEVNSVTFGRYLKIRQLGQQAIQLGQEIIST